VQIFVYVYSLEFFQKVSTNSHFFALMSAKY
jgi:hypothetical protein